MLGPFKFRVVYIVMVFCCCPFLAVSQDFTEIPDSLWVPFRSQESKFVYNILGTRPQDSAKVNVLLKFLSGASAGAHRHSVDMHIKVLKGEKPILMGESLASAKVQTFFEGESFVIPAGYWHVEWWDTLTVEEISYTGPMRTEFAKPQGRK